MQPWDPSVKALTAVPQTLQMMNDKLDWTKDLGEAYLAQADDVATSIQRLRARADASGNLKPSDQVRVKRIPPPPPPADLAVGEPLPPEYIAIEPVQPDVLFVPVYDPFLVYGVWPWPAYRPFYWYPPGFVSVGVFGWGAPLVVGAAIWSSYNWYSRRVDVDVVRFNRFNHMRLADTPENRAWRHDPVHRGNIAYSNPKLREEFRTNANVTRGNQQLFSKQGTGAGTGKGIINTGKFTPDATGKHFPSNANSGGSGNQNKGRENFSRSATINPGSNNENNNKGNNNFKGDTRHDTNRNVNRNAGNNFNPGKNVSLGGSRGPGSGGGGGGGGKGGGGGGGGDRKGKGH